jgi:hypothetical protein
MLEYDTKQAHIKQEIGFTLFNIILLIVSGYLLGGYWWLMVGGMVIAFVLSAWKRVKAIHNSFLPLDK